MTVQLSFFIINIFSLTLLPTLYTYVRYWKTRALALKFLSEEKKEKKEKKDGATLHLRFKKMLSTKY